MPVQNLRTVTAVVQFKVGFVASNTEAISLAEGALSEINSSDPKIISMTVETSG
jgi:hypothetical protein